MEFLFCFEVNMTSHAKPFRCFARRGHKSISVTLISLFAPLPMLL